MLFAHARLGEGPHEPPVFHLFPCALVNFISCWVNLLVRFGFSPSYQAKSSRYCFKTGQKSHRNRKIRSVFIRQHFWISVVQASHRYIMSLPQQHQTLEQAGSHMSCIDYFIILNQGIGRSQGRQTFGSARGRDLFTEKSSQLWFLFAFCFGLLLLLFVCCLGFFVGWGRQLHRSQRNKTQLFHPLENPI